MPPGLNGDLLPLMHGPKLILYHQTHHSPGTDKVVSLLPLITNRTGVTHIIVAAIHLNDRPGDITLNDNPPDHEKFNVLWSEVAWLQASGVKVLGMLGGAAKGTFARLDGDAHSFEAFYSPLRDVIRRHKLDGIDLDVEEPMSLAGITRLIDRLRVDFGPNFLITLAPVATALLPGQPHLSEFDYRQLEQLRGHDIAWYNTQFYCGWGDASTTAWYDAIISCGWNANKVIMGLVTNPELGAGHVSLPQMHMVLRNLRARHPTFGGVMGWEYFNALPGGKQQPWDWASNMAQAVRTPLPVAAPPAQQAPIRPFGAPLPPPAHTFSSESVGFLLELGFTQPQAVAALNMTNGNVDQAAGILLGE